MHRRIRPLGLALALAACGSGQTPTQAAGAPTGESSNPATVTITAPVASLVVGDAVALTAEVRTSSNTLLPHAQVIWTSEQPALVTVSASGIAHGVAAGTVIITARSDSATGTLILRVTPTAASTIQITGATGNLMVGQNIQLGSRVLDARNQPIANAAVEWSSDATAVVSVQSNGVMRGVGVGSATITATLATISSTFTVTSRPKEIDVGPQGIQVAVGDSLKLTASSLDAAGNPLSFPLPVTWTSSHPEYITVSQSGWAVARHGAFGTETPLTHISATAGGVTGDMSLAVAPFAPGAPAGIRYVHTATDVEALTFQANKTESVSLTFGQSREVTAASGNVQVSVNGFPLLPGGTDTYFGSYQAFAGLLPPGQHLSIYAVGDNPIALVAALWDTHAPVASDNVLVRIMYASNFSRTYAGNNLYLLPAGAPIDNSPLLCYVDLAGESTDYVLKKAGGYDIVLVDPSYFVLTPGNYGQELIRFHVTPQPGHATTYVITGRDPSTMHLMTVLDP